MRRSHLLSIIGITALAMADLPKSRHDDNPSASIPSPYRRGSGGVDMRAHNHRMAKKRKRLNQIAKKSRKAAREVK